MLLVQSISKSLSLYVPMPFSEEGWICHERHNFYFLLNFFYNVRNSTRLIARGSCIHRIIIHVCFCDMLTDNDNDDLFGKSYLPSNCHN